MSRRIVVILPLPSPALSPNARVHWGVKAAAVKSYREVAWAHALREMLGEPPMDKATINPVFYWPDRRRRDDDNAVASLKAARDGLADGGVVRNDADFVMAEAEFHVDRENPRVELIIQEAMR